MNYESEKEKNSEDEYNWDEYFENEDNETKLYDEYKRPEYESMVISEDNKSLKDSLLLQLHLSGINEKLIFTGEEIIWSLNDEGYFTDDEDDLLKDLNIKKAGTAFKDEDFSFADLNESLSYIQRKLDPPGIAARNLKECLLIQIERSDKDAEIKKLSEEVLKNHFEELRLKKYEKISKDLNIDLPKVKEIFDFIHKLNPKPGYADEIASNEYIIPDLTLKKAGDRYEIILNDRYTPSLRISKTYRDLYSNKKNNLDRDTKDYIISNFNKAKWFIDAINSRRETLMKIMEAIIEKQKYFFDNSDSGLKPMYEKDIAEDIRMDSSTVSRAVRGKYVQTDSGIHELRSFFTTPLATNEGEDVSNKEAKIKLKELIDAEDKSKPLSDEELSAEMNKLGYKIARRTVAKYREAINLPIAKLRREIQ
ncbi:MAG: RNA polymerase factor sigma-54 [Ignavibacteria bacterium]|nr:RNA polymerase factor sigma-54 [Ignavibacteria bacterium]